MNIFCQNFVVALQNPFKKDTCAKMFAKKYFQFSQQNNILGGKCRFIFLSAISFYLSIFLCSIGCQKHSCDTSLRANFLQIKTRDCHRNQELIIKTVSKFINNLFSLLQILTGSFKIIQFGFCGYTFRSEKYNEKSLFKFCHQKVIL